MNRILIPFLALVALTLARPAAAELKVAVVDIQKIIDTSEAGVIAKTQLGDAFQTRQAELEKQKGEIKKLKDELDQQSVMLSEATRKQKEDQLEKMKKEFMEKLSVSEKELQAKDAELTQEVLKDLEGIILEMGKQEGYDLILERSESNVLWTNPALDITDRVIAKYNEQSKKPKIPAEKSEE